MLNMLFPREIDSTYRGHKLAPWFLLIVVFMRIVQSLGVFFGGRFVVSSADGIPLDTYTAAGAQTVMALFALVSLDRLLIGLICVLVLLRYRSVISFFLMLLLLQDLGKRLVLVVFPITRVGTPPGLAVNLVLLALTMVGLVLSLWKHDDPRAHG
jgi:hypothetical protein